MLSWWDIVTFDRELRGEEAQSFLATPAYSGLSIQLRCKGSGGGVGGGGEGEGRNWLLIQMPQDLSDFEIKF